MAIIIDDEEKPKEIKDVRFLDEHGREIDLLGVKEQEYETTRKFFQGILVVFVIGLLVKWCGS